ncbi:zinc finger BED domain-containing protein RICESLEEPER 2-like [Eutrema salsugineum]|uniref:zinc finger BED domain-containing protein RICESLEEPER 2-like n=1 Tax=Eutrema salsugineum TaxID=72664 RepID=UPI000CECED61|nr:zinc finger BED domain-containing protein RICESLEEPER 2-like [Eutrema salsugineum]
MDNGDLASGSGSGSSSDMEKKRKLDDSVNDSIDNCEDDFVDDCEDDCEDDEEMVADDLTSTAEKEKDGYNAMAKWFISDGINPNIIKKASFAKFMRLVKPDLPLSVPLVEKEVLLIHDEYKEKAKKFLKDFQGKITLSYEWLLLGNERTIDHIDDPILHADFVRMAAHFIDDNWKVRKLILGYSTDEFIPLDDIYPYHFRTAVQGFEIENKVSTILVPNIEDLDEKAVDAIRKCIEAKGNSSIKPPVFLVYCCADLFRLMVEDLYGGISPLLYENLRMLVSWGRCLSAPNWNVNLNHLQQAVDMKNEDAFSKDEIYDDYDKPSDEEWIKI